MLFGFVALDRHEIREFADSIRMQKPRRQFVGFREIDLPPDSLFCGGDFEPPDFLLVKQTGKDARGIEVWEATPVNCSISSDQSHSMAIADDSMVTDLFTLRMHVFSRVPFFLRKIAPASTDKDWSTMASTHPSPRLRQAGLFGIPFHA
jgi:hypothetical protein